MAKSTGGNHLEEIKAVEQRAVAKGQALAQQKEAQKNRNRFL